MGGLFPANKAADDAMAAIQGRVRIEIKRTRGNVARNGLYWSRLALAAPMLSEKAPGLTTDLLHKVLKDRYGLVKLITLPSGEIVKDYESTSFAKMTEVDRMAFVDWSLETLSKWLGVDVTTLRREAELAG